MDRLIIATFAASIPLIGFISIVFALLDVVQRIGK